jgi:hypothetical protein
MMEKATLKVDQSENSRLNSCLLAGNEDRRFLKTSRLTTRVHEGRQHLPSGRAAHRRLALPAFLIWSCSAYRAKTVQRMAKAEEASALRDRGPFLDGWGSRKIGEERRASAPLGRADNERPSWEGGRQPQSQEEQQLRTFGLGGYIFFSRMLRAMLAETGEVEGQSRCA